MKIKATAFFHCIVLILFCGCAATVQEPPKEPKLKTGLYVDFGSRGAGVIRWAQLLKNSPQIELRLLDGKDLAAGNFRDLDLFVMPGGSGFKQWESMKEAGQKNLRSYVENGGRYFGTCAGMSIILNEPKRVPMMPYVRTPGNTPGGITAKVKLNEEGKKLLNLPAVQMLRYHNGPIVKPSETPLDKIRCEVLGSFACEFNQKGPIRRPMYGTPAVFRIFFDKGELFVTNCHPEIYSGTHTMIPAGIRLLTGKTIAIVYPAKKRGALRVGFFCSGMGGKKPVEEVLALDAKPEIDIYPLTGEDIACGDLEHCDMLYVTPAFPTDEKLFALGRNGELIKDFVKRGGKIVRSIEEVK